MNRKIILPVVVVAGTVAWLVYNKMHEPDITKGVVASGTVEATQAALGFQMPGRIDRIAVREGDKVTTGDTLAWLDHVELNARKAQAQAQLNAARATLAEIEAGARSEEIEQARIALHAAVGRLNNAQQDFDRTQQLVRGGAVAQEVLDNARLALDQATSQKNQAEQQVKLLESGARPERITTQRAVIAQGEAALRQVDAAIGNAVVVAPFDGVVSTRDREPGETVGAGIPVVTLLNNNDRWIRIYIREDQIGAVHLGDPVSITGDTYANRTYSGAVSFIASEAEFTPRNVQTAEERVKLVYAVKVKITSDSSADLKPGMPADVRIGGNGTANAPPK